MRLAGKTACFLFLFMLISPLYAEPLNDPQPSPQGEDTAPAEELPADGLFFFEELFIFEEAFSFGESFTGEETLPGEESLLSEETLPNEESPSGEETPLAEETFSEPQPGLSAPSPDAGQWSGEGSPLVEESRPGEENLLSEETLPSEKVLPTEEHPPGEDSLLAEDTFLDDDAFFFEAPPLIFEVPTFEIRSLDTIFPNFSRRQRIRAMSNEGVRRSFEKDESPALVPNPDLGIDLLGRVMKKNPSHLIEALVVVPYNEKEFDLLDIYNALGRIEKIKDYPTSVNNNDYYIFTESTRIESARNRRAIPDPLPAVTLPFSQTIYLRLKEINFGNLFIRGDISISMYGITYSMTNFTDVRYFLVPIVKAERFITIIYLEPVKEGILIYSMSGFYLPGFIADKVNLTPNINRRIEIFINWITDGLRIQEGSTAEPENADTGDTPQ
jgi:hypothetical protein